MNRRAIQCECGTISEVSFAEAGVAVRCRGCGTEIQVPSLRELRDLPEGAVVRPASTDHSSSPLEAKAVDTSDSRDENAGGGSLPERLPWARRPTIDREWEAERRKYLVPAFGYSPGAPPSRTEPTIRPVVLLSIMGLLCLAIGICDIAVQGDLVEVLVLMAFGVLFLGLARWHYDKYQGYQRAKAAYARRREQTLGKDDSKQTRRIE